MKGQTLSEKRHGTWTGFFNNGGTNYIHNYANGKIHGEFISYDQYGTILAKGSYKNDAEHGYFYYYDSQYPNNLKQEGSFINGRKNGEWIIYKSGEVVLKILYKNGKKIKVLQN